MARRFFVGLFCVLLFGNFGCSTLNDLGCAICAAYCVPAPCPPVPEATPRYVK